MLNKTIYLDHAASTPLVSPAYDVLIQSLIEDYANPAANHKLGRNQNAKLELTRGLFFDLLKLNPSDYFFIFTGSATESNVTISRGLSINKNEEALVSSGDHPSLTHAADPKSGHVIDIPLDLSGAIQLDHLLSMVNTKTRLLSFSHVNSITGRIHSIAAICTQMKSLHPHIHIHIDASQSFSKVSFPYETIPIDSLTISSHKIGGPRGISGLLVRKTIKFQPLLTGGGHELSLRASTPAVPLILAFFAAAKYQLANIDSHHRSVYSLRQHFIDQLQTTISDIIFPFSANLTHISPYITMFILPKIPSDVLIRHLGEKNIILSTSSACSSKSKKASPIFNALRIDPQYHRHVLRASLSPATTLEDINIAVLEIACIYNRLRRLFD